MKVSQASDVDARSDSDPEASAGLRWSLPILLLLAAVVLASPVPQGMTTAAHRLLAVTLLMGGLWVTQALPLAATSLIPLALFPFLGIMSAEHVSKAFVNDTLFLYLGGMVIALGIERWNLHRRIALTLVSWIGVGPRRLVLGFLIATAGLSMWISNTACTLLMLPIAVAMLKTFDECHHSGNGSETVYRRSDRIAVPVLLAITYAASLGGMTTLVGTPTNNAAMGIYRDQLPDAPDISVAQWMLVAVPIGAIYLAIAWFLLTRGLPTHTDGDAALRQDLRQRLLGLGRIGVAERRMLAMFGLTGLLWVSRKPLQFGTVTVLPGWMDAWTAAFRWISTLTGKSDEPWPADDMISDSSVAMLMAVLLFVLPSGVRSDRGHSLKLMDWRTACRLPWDMILIFGGGFALADGFKTTKLSDWLGQALQAPLQDMPVWVVIAVICGMMIFLSEFSSNIAMVTALMPTLLAIAAPLGLDPRIIFIPAALAASCGFMLPIATPPNAIVFGTGRIPVRQMMAYGLVLNLIGIPLLTLGALLIVRPVLTAGTMADTAASATPPDVGHLLPTKSTP